MNRYVDKDANGKIIADFANEQFPGQEFIADGSPEADTIALARAKTVKAAEIARAYAAAIHRGATHRGKVIQIDPESRGNIGDMAKVADLVMSGKADGRWPSDLERKGWRTLDNKHLPVTPAGMIALSLDVMQHFVAIRFQASALKDALAAAQTTEDVAAVDVTTGWPGEE